MAFGWESGNHAASATRELRKDWGVGSESAILGLVRPDWRGLYLPVWRTPDADWAVGTGAVGIRHSAADPRQVAHNEGHQV